MEISGKKFKITSRMLKALVEKVETCMNSKEIETSKKKKKKEMEKLKALQQK